MKVSPSKTLWHRENIGGNFFVVSPDGRTHLQIFHRADTGWIAPSRIERALCHILNSTPAHKLEMSEEEMDRRGLPKFPF